MPTETRASSKRSLDNAPQPLPKKKQKSAADLKKMMKELGEEDMVAFFDLMKKKMKKSVVEDEEEEDNGNKQGGGEGGNGGNAQGNDNGDGGNNDKGDKNTVGGENNNDKVKATGEDKIESLTGMPCYAPTPLPNFLFHLEGGASRLPCEVPFVPSQGEITRVLFMPHVVSVVSGVLARFILARMLS